MTTFEVEEQTPGFFASGTGLIIPAIFGAIFGALIAVGAPILQSLTCNNNSITSCMPDAIGTFRVGLVIISILMMIAMVIVRIERPIYVILPALVIFWNLFLVMPNFLLRTAIYAALGLLVFTTFSWIAKVYDWLLATSLTVIVTIILLAF